MAFDRSLEIGCGFGRLSLVFAEFSNEHIAVDINPDALAMARTAYPDLTFRQAAPGHLEFPDDHFGLVCTWTVAQHVPPDRIEQMCAEIKRVLAPGGMLLICEETRNPGVYANFSWHRSLDEYAELFAPMSLERCGYISEIDRIPGMESPGEVMVFADRNA